MEDENNKKGTPIVALCTVFISISYVCLEQRITNVFTCVMTTSQEKVIRKDDDGVYDKCFVVVGVDVCRSNYRQNRKRCRQIAR